MRTNILLAMCVFLMSIGCKETSSEKSEDVATEITETKEGKKVVAPKKIKNCDDFLDTYEAWSNNILEVMAKHKDDPIGLATSSEYINTMTKGVGFIQDWGTISTSCAMNPTYETRMKTIQKNMEARQKELGFK